MYIEGNVKLPGVDVEGQEDPKVVEIDDTEISPDQHPIEMETATKAEFEVTDAP